MTTLLGKVARILTREHTEYEVVNLDYSKGELIIKRNKCIPILKSLTELVFKENGRKTSLRLSEDNKKLLVHTEEGDYYGSVIGSFYVKDVLAFLKGETK